jgi:hypothetical protein
MFSAFDIAAAASRLNSAILLLPLCCPRRLASDQALGRPCDKHASDNIAARAPLRRGSLLKLDRQGLCNPQIDLCVPHHFHAGDSVGQPFFSQRTQSGPAE